jgi:hypothetical protein
MRLKPFLLLICLLSVPGLAIAGEKTVYGLNEYAQLAGYSLTVRG